MWNKWTIINRFKKEINENKLQKNFVPFYFKHVKLK